MELNPITDEEVFEHIPNGLRVSLNQYFLNQRNVELCEDITLKFQPNFNAEQFVDEVWLSPASLELLYLFSKEYPEHIASKINEEAWSEYFAAYISFHPTLRVVLYTLKLITHLNFNIFTQEFYELIARHFCHKLQEITVNLASLDFMLNLFIRNGIYMKHAEYCVNQKFNDYATAFSLKYYDNMKLFDLISQNLGITN